MRHNLTALLTLDDEIVRTLRAAEAPHPIKLAPLPDGLRGLYTPRAALLTHPDLLRMGTARWLLWRIRLAHSSPTDAGLHAFARRVTGYLLWQLALARYRAGRPLPLKQETTDVPGWALREVRAEGDQDPEASGEVDPVDPAEYWLDYGDATALSDADLAALEGVTTPAKIAQSAGQSLTLRDILANVADGLTGMETMQLVDSAWSGQATLWAGQDVYDNAGFAGVFDLRSPAFYDYLRQQTGYLMTGIDARTRYQVAELLWGLAGGWSGVGRSLSVDAMSRYLYGLSSVFGNDLAEMAPARAFMIATTEMARAESFGSFVSMWTSGVQRKRWLATAGACQFCLTNADEGAIPITASFPSGVQSPPGHPLCRCCNQPVVPDTFNPADWRARDSGPLMDLLFSSGGAIWPNVDLGDMGDLSDLRSAAKPVARRASTDTVTRADLGRAYRHVLDAAALEWLHEVHHRVPRSERELRQLAVGSHQGWDVADARYLRRVVVGIAAATQAHRVELHEGHAV